MTMAFVVMCLSTAFSALVQRRDPTSGLVVPVLKALVILSIPVVLTVLSTQLPFAQAGLLTRPLTGLQWLACLGLALVTPVLVEAEKWIRRRRGRQPRTRIEVIAAVNPSWAASTTTT